MDDKGGGALGGWMAALALAILSALQHLVYKKRQPTHADQSGAKLNQILDRLSVLEERAREGDQEHIRLRANHEQILLEMERMEDRLSRRIRQGSTGD